MRVRRIFDCEEESNKIEKYQKEGCDVKKKEISIGRSSEAGRRRWFNCFLRNFTSVTLCGRFYCAWFEIANSSEGWRSYQQGY